MSVYKVRLEIQSHDPSDDDVEPFAIDKVVTAEDERAAGIKAQSAALDFYTQRDDVPYEATIISVKERIG